MPDASTLSAASSSSLYTSGLVTGEALHTSRVASRRSRSQLSEERRQSEQASHLQAGRYARGKSAKIVKEARVKALRALFERLDGEGEGVIDGSTLPSKLGFLPPDLALALSPLLESCNGEFLAFSDFRALVDRALPPVANGPRECLLPKRGQDREEWKREEEEKLTSECSFAPKVDKRSAQIVSAKRQVGRPTTHLLTLT